MEAESKAVTEKAFMKPCKKVGKEVTSYTVINPAKGKDYVAGGNMSKENAEKLIAKLNK